MMNRDDLVRFHGVVMEVEVREKFQTTTRGGGGFIYRGMGFIAPPSVSAHFWTVQEFWLRGANGEKHFQINGKGLPMRDGQKITVVWLRNRLIAYVNHTTGEYLAEHKEVKALAGPVPNPAYLHVLIPTMVVFFLLVGLPEQAGVLAGHLWAQNLGRFFFLALFGILLVTPFVGLCVGLWRNRAYEARYIAAKSMVQQEMDFLLSRKLSPFQPS